MQTAIEQVKKMIKEEANSINIFMDREDRLHYSIRIGCLQELIERLEKLQQPYYSQGGTGGKGGPNTFPIYMKLPQEESILSIDEDAKQEPTTDELLDELGASIHQMRDGSRDWKAYINLDAFEEYYEAYGLTPRLALLALKDKLSTNQL